MEELLGVVIVFSFIAFVIYIIYLGFHPEKQRDNNIKAVFDDMNKKMKPIEKHRTIQELFIESAKHVQNSGYYLDSVNSGIYTAELALHIFALFISNRISAISTLKGDNQMSEYFNGIEFNSFVICVKEFLNLIIENNLNKEGIDNETVKKIIVTRVNFIFKEEDFETRNFNFQNLCAIAINYEDDCVFYVGSYKDFEYFGVELGNPLNMMILPSAYNVGLVDEFLEKLKKVL